MSANLQRERERERVTSAYLQRSQNVHYSSHRPLCLECLPTEACLNREEWNNGLVKFDCVVRWDGTINMEMNDILIDRNSSLF